ncbi:MAG: hypothetical protein KDJ34_18370 [Candidatus Competibacteraceae bacterium]|nr:hypothetical protein [Candidatus Competibacteraceae bacterium]MCP5134182.1 hypothetical protein [Gammaproteobacteria bacterium]
MRNKPMPVADKLLLRKRASIETINSPLKNIQQIKHIRQPRKPSLDLLKISLISRINVKKRSCCCTKKVAYSGSKLN